jgi:N-acetylated-alpha-linked acidic dipeptidase
VPNWIKVILLLGSATCWTSASDHKPQLSGYSSSSSASERQWEAKFLDLPTQTNLRNYMKRISAHPHHVGSSYGKNNAEWIAAKFNEWGLDSRIETFDTLFPTPAVRRLELLDPIKFVAKLEEPALAADPKSAADISKQLPTYNVYSRDGDVTALLVYVNYGLPEDYDFLERMGVSVKGAIVIARYGRSHRAIKPRVAAQHGAVGCILYSDPQDDGYFEGDVFPEGAWRPSFGVERGSVMDMFIHPGDPLIPGVGVRKDAERLTFEDAQTITKIPVLPISSSDAQPLLFALKGPVAPRNWRGALPQTYHIGPGLSKVHLTLQFNWQIRTLYNVIGKIPGSTSSDEWIIRGNHHDAWVYGAGDPGSGLSALMEEARGLGALTKQGWQPKRTILYCVWDGEEAGLLGSTAWGEVHDNELRRHAAVYINSDQSGRGYLHAGGSHTLEQFLNDIARDIPDPETQLTVWERAHLKRIADAKSREEREQARLTTSIRFDALGSGSDWTVFLDHLGIASLDLAYEGEGPDIDAILHSAYDDFFWYTHFCDPDFLYERSLAQTAGISVMRLADADLLPFDFIHLAIAVQRYVKELQDLFNEQKNDIAERNQELKEGVFLGTSDPKNPLIPPPSEETPPSLNLWLLKDAADAFSNAAGHYHSISTRSDIFLSGNAQFRQVNSGLLRSERELTSPDGLPGRPWYEHLIYAPGQDTGYEVKTIPGVREAIERKQWRLVDREIIRAARAIEKETALIDVLTQELNTSSE